MERNGFVLVPNVLSAQEVGTLRRMVTEYSDTGRGTYHANEARANLNVFAPEPDGMTALLRHPGIARIVKEVVGPDAFFMRELGVAIGGCSGWHKDTHGLARSVRAEHDGYGVYKILIYPQDHIALAPDDFALRVRKGSHWKPDPLDGEVENLFVRAGDVIVIDCRTSHRGRDSTVEHSNVLKRALYFPFNRGVPGVTFHARRKLWSLRGKQERQLVTLLYGKRNAFSDEYMTQGRKVLKERHPELDVDQPLPPSWKQALDSVGIGY
jgi:hypothetical protein